MPRTTVPTLWNVAGLAMAALGIVIQIIGGVDYPTVPPGLIILVVAAGMVLFARWRWMLYAGVVVPLFLLVGGLIAPTGRHNIADPGHVGPFVGTAVQMIGVVLALVAGVLAVRVSRTRHEALSSAR
jgi:hypothetical protein